MHVSGKQFVMDLLKSFGQLLSREAIGYRVPGAVAWNLFDIDAKFGDVEPLDNVLDYLRRNDI